MPTIYADIAICCCHALPRAASAVQVVREYATVTSPYAADFRHAARYALRCHAAADLSLRFAKRAMPATLLPATLLPPPLAMLMLLLLRFR